MVEFWKPKSRVMLQFLGESKLCNYALENNGILKTEKHCHCMGLGATSSICEGQGTLKISLVISSATTNDSCSLKAMLLNEIAVEDWNFTYNMCAEYLTLHPQSRLNVSQAEAPVCFNSARSVPAILVVHHTVYDSFSDVGESRSWFASKNLTPCRMHWNAFLIAQIIAKCHSFPNM